jgi:hypothetical protein
MATQTTNPTPAQLTGEALSDTAINTRVGTLEHWRQYRAERKRRVIVQWLRRTAHRAGVTNPIRRRREALLHCRAAAVQKDLLEIAAMLERTHTPNPACVATLHEVLANGCDSPLYNAEMDISELHRMLNRVRSGLGHDAGEQSSAVGSSTATPGKA